MNHLPFILAAYGLFLVTAIWYPLDAWQRMARARRRLAAIDPRASR